MATNSERRRAPGPLKPLSSSLPPDVAAFVAQLRAGHAKTGLGLADLSRGMYSSKASVSRWLNGLAMPTQDQAADWARLCGMDEDTMRRLWKEADTSFRAGNQNDRDDVVVRLPERAGSAASRVIGRKTSIIVAAGAVIAAGALAFAIAGLSRQTSCQISPPVALNVPGKSGRTMGITVEAKCAFAAERQYLLVEEMPDVDAQRNPHTVYFVKTHLKQLERGEAAAHQMLLEEPIGTKAKFYVISVDAGGALAMELNKVRDEGLLQLPTGTRVESEIFWHVKEWE